jgi:hypothetical protein
MFDEVVGIVKGGTKTVVVLKQAVPLKLKPGKQVIPKEIRLHVAPLK